MAICPIICSIDYLERALMHDVACEFACAVGCAETISANVLDLKLVMKDDELELWTASLTTWNFITYGTEEPLNVKY